MRLHRGRRWPIFVRRVRLGDEREAPGATVTFHRGFRDPVEPVRLQNVIAKQRIKHYEVPRRLLYS